jgi:hypothetical protein
MKRINEFKVREAKAARVAVRRRYAELVDTPVSLNKLNAVRGFVQPSVER